MNLTASLARKLAVRDGSHGYVIAWSGGQTWAPTHEGIRAEVAHAAAVHGAVSVWRVEQDGSATVEVDRRPAALAVVA